MDYEKIFGIIAMVGYLIYSFNKARKQKEEIQKKKQPQPTPKEYTPKEEPTLQDMFKKIFSEVEEMKQKKVVDQKPMEQPKITQRELKENLKRKFNKKQKQIEITETPAYETAESLQSAEATAIEGEKSVFTEMKTTIVSTASVPYQEREKEISFEFNAHDAVIYSAILNRPYQ